MLQMIANDWGVHAVANLQAIFGDLILEGLASACKADTLQTYRHYQIDCKLCRAKCGRRVEQLLGIFRPSCIRDFKIPLCRTAA